MIKVSDVLDCIQTYAPPSMCFDGDNVGLLVGNLDSEVTKVLITLDVDEFVVREAIDKKAELIISHHPLMFRPISSLTETNPEQRCIRLMVENSISLISAHTNLDSVQGGLNDFLSSKLSIVNTSVIDVNGEYRGNPYGFGRVGEFEEEMSLSEVLNLVKTRLGCMGMRYVGSPETLIKKVAVNSGSGADVLTYCIENKIDLLITGDVKYNQARCAYESGLCVIDAGHYETERIAVELFKEILSTKFNTLSLEISDANIPVFEYKF